jgi:Flp pilus assembly pilin Flp
MRVFKSSLRWCLADHAGCEGQDLAEYAMLAALIAVVAILAVAAVGGALVTLWGNITAAFAALP